MYERWREVSEIVARFVALVFPVLTEHGFFWSEKER